MSACTCWSWQKRNERRMSHGTYLQRVTMRNALHNAWLATLICLIWVSGPVRGEPPTVTPELKGNWRIAFFLRQDEFWGEKNKTKKFLTPPIAEDTLVKITASKIVFSRGGKETEFSYTLGEGTGHRQDIDLKAPCIDGKERTFPGIFKLENGQLDMCFGLDGERPTVCEAKHNET